MSHLAPASSQANSLRQCYDAIEQNPRSLEALGKDVNHHHFVALISEKLPQRVLYQLYVLKEEEEDWTVTKLCQLLGKHISALEMAAGTEFSQVSAHIEVNKQTSHTEGHKRPPQMRLTASGLFTGQNRPAATLGRSIWVITCLRSKQSLVGYLVEEPNLQIMKLLTNQTQLFLLL